MTFYKHLQSAFQNQLTRQIPTESQVLAYNAQLFKKKEIIDMLYCIVTASPLEGT